MASRLTRNTKGILKIQKSFKLKEMISDSNLNPQEEIRSTGSGKHVVKYKRLYKYVFLFSSLNFFT